MPGNGQNSRKGASIRIAHVVGGMNRGGVETWLMNVLRSVNRRRFQMDFIVHTHERCSYDDEIRSLGSRIIPCSNSSKPWAYGSALGALLREQGPYDVIHSHVHHFSGLVLRAAAKTTVPVRIAHSHNDTRASERNRGLFRKAYLRLTESYIRKYASLGLAASEDAGQSLFTSTWKLDPRWQVLHYGIDLNPFSKPIEQPSIRADLNIPSDAPVIGHIGRFVRQKNHSFLLQVAKAVIQREPRARILLLGEGPLRPEIENQATELGIADHVIFGGVRGDIPQVMRKGMDAFLFPSLFEGLGIVLLEAQAAGLPSVISDVIPAEVDVMKPLIRRLPLSLSPEKWAEQVLQALRLSSESSRTRALDQIAGSSFDIRVSAARLCSLYENACSLQPAPEALGVSA